MTNYPDLNPIKITQYDVTNVPNYRIKNYESLGRGVAQKQLSVNDNMATINGDIMYQVWTNLNETFYQMVMYIDNELFTFGSLDAPTNGATVDTVVTTTGYNIYNITIPQQAKEGVAYIKTGVLISEPETSYSELFHVSNSDTVDLGRDILNIRYSGDEGDNNGYYWDGEVQEYNLLFSEFSDVEISADKEVSEGIENNQEVLNSTTIRKDTYTLCNVPYYLFEKTIKASQTPYLEINGEPMLLDAQDILDKRDGRVDFTITYRQKEQTNQY